MSSAREVCVDASLAVKVVVAEPDSDKAEALFEEWANEGTLLIAPAFFAVETDSILRQKVALRKELTPEQTEAAFAKLQALPIQQISMPGQRQRAWEVATDPWGVEDVSMVVLDLKTLYSDTAKLSRLPEYLEKTLDLAGEGNAVVLTGVGPVWLYLKIAHALHGKAKKLIYRSPVTGDVAIFDHDPF